MNYAFMSFSCPKATLAEALDLVKANGYTGFEPRTDAGHAHGIETSMTPEERREARELAEEKQIALCCLATSVKLSGRRARGDNMDAARRAVELCADLGIPRIRVFGGPIDEGCTRREAIEETARALDDLSDEIGSADICLCLETHDSWCEPEHVAAVMRLCRGTHVGVNWDLMHPLLAAHAELRETFGWLKPYIRHVHIHGGTYEGGVRFLPIEGNVIDHRLALEELASIRYDGWLSGEWINWNRPGYLAEERETMRRYEREAGVR